MTEEQIKALLAQLLADGGYVTKTDLNGTAAMIRGLKDSVDGLKGANPLEALVTAGLLEKQADGTYAAKTTAPAKKDDKQVPEWQIQIDELKNQNAAKDKALAAEKQAREDGELKSSVISAFEKAGAVNASRDYVHVLGNVKRGEDGSFHTIKKDEFGVETKVPLENAFGEYLTANPELRKASNKPGSGTPVGSTGSNTTNTTSADEYIANRAKLLNTPGEVKITF